MICSSCGKETGDDSTFCGQCGAPIKPRQIDPFAEVAHSAKKSGTTKTAESAKHQNKTSSNIAVKKTSTRKPSAEEAAPAFAKGLPEWSLVPPNVMIVRH